MRKNQKNRSLLLKNAGDFLAQFSEQSDHVYWICSHDLKKIQYISPSFERIWGRSCEELYLNPKIWMTFLHPDDVVHPHPILEMAEKIITHGKAARYHEHYRIIRPDGETRWIVNQGFPLCNDKGVCFGISGIAMDVTEQKKTELALKFAQEKSDAANHAKTDFITNMSHDIRTPLAGVVGMSHLLENELQNQDQKQHAHLIHECGTQLLGLLNGILDDVSIDNANEHDLHIESFDLRQCIQNMVQLERPSTEQSGIQLIINVDSDVPRYIVGDQTKIHRILLNLLGNSIKFTKIGHVEICVTVINQHDACVSLQFRVIDTGIGIPLALQDQVFDRFFQVDPTCAGVTEGHGIGLHIAQSYIELLGGHIKLTSEEGVGTTFYFDLSFGIVKHENVLLPTSSLPHQPLQSHQQPLAPNPDPISDARNKPHLLLVEDHPVCQLVLENMVSRLNLPYISADHGEQALDWVKAHDFELIVIDFRLPDMSGNDLTRLIRAWETEQRKKPAVIIGLTAQTKSQIQDSCFQAGMNEVFTKPMEFSDLQAITSRYLTIRIKDAVNVSVAQEQNSSTTGQLGRDLPDTEQQLFKLNEFPVLNANATLKAMGNNVKLFNEILTSLVEKDLACDLAEIERAHECGDWESVEKIAHRMKGGFVYCGLTKLAIACQYLERYRKAGHATQLEALYQQVRAVADETATTIHRWLSLL